MKGLPSKIRACLFDMDGVLTKTATVHASAWKMMFDDYLRAQAAQNNQPFTPFDEAADYRIYVDGKPRQDGTRSFLTSRGIFLEEGTPDDPPTANTVHGLANRKRDLVMSIIHRDGVTVYSDAMELLAEVERAGLTSAVVSSSAHAIDILEAAGIASKFHAIIDGNFAAQHGLPGKPAPDIFLAGATALGVSPAQAAVFEDAIAGVQAGKAGKFGLVVGVDRINHRAELIANGADIVVDNLTKIEES